MEDIKRGHITGLVFSKLARLSRNRRELEDFCDFFRKHNAAIVFADSDDYPAIADVTADFVYARLQRTAEEHATGYSPADLDAWTARAKRWAPTSRRRRA